MKSINITTHGCPSLSKEIWCFVIGSFTTTIVTNAFLLMNNQLIIVEIVTNMMIHVARNVS